MTKISVYLSYIIVLICLNCSISITGTKFLLRKRPKEIVKFSNATKDSNNKVSIDSSAAAAAKNADSMSKIAGIIGYSMGLGANFLFFPIFMGLYKNQNADGFSTATWISSLTGITLSIIYPFKMKFPVSTYLEQLTLSIQSFIILGIVCTFKKQMKTLLLCSATFMSTIIAVTNFEIPLNILAVMQTSSIVFSNYALLPQIIMNYQRKKFSWSAFTAFFSGAGNAMRIFTTLQLTKDSLLLSGYAIGFVLNIILILQYLAYKK